MYVSKKQEDRARAIAAAKRYVDADALFVDTETSGVTAQAEICDIAFVNLRGETEFESLVKPLRPIPAETTAIHHISNEMVRDSPTFDQILDQIFAVCAGRMVVAYNMAFDGKMILQSAAARGIILEPDAERLRCAMLLYAAYHGEWNDRRGSYRWVKLGVAAEQCGLTVPENLHRARVDADLGRQILLHMARQDT